MTPRVITISEARQTIASLEPTFLKIAMAMRVQIGLMDNQIAALGDDFIGRMPMAHYAGIEHSFLEFKADVRALREGARVLAGLVHVERQVRELMAGQGMMEAAE